MLKIELIVAIVAGVVSIVSAMLAYIAQTNTAKVANDASLAQNALQHAHERQRPFIDMQVKYYVEATEVAARIAGTNNGIEKTQLMARFWELYWGPLALVEDESVAAAMIEYGRHLENPPHDPKKLSSLSLQVAHACRDSLKRLWVPEIGTITSVRPEGK